MNELEEWFEREFGSLGFYLTPMMYNPETFAPSRGIVYTNLRGETIMTRMKLTHELVQDITFYGLDPIEELREIFREQIDRFLEEKGLKDFKPKKRINKFKL